MPPQGLRWIDHGPDARLTPRARRVFYGLLVAIVATGVILVALAR